MPLKWAETFFKKKVVQYVCYWSSGYVQQYIASSIDCFHSKIILGKLLLKVHLSVECTWVFWREMLIWNLALSLSCFGLRLCNEFSFYNALKLAIKCLRVYNPEVLCEFFSFQYRKSIVPNVISLTCKWFNKNQPVKKNQWAWVKKSAAIKSNINFIFLCAEDYTV